MDQFIGRNLQNKPMHMVKRIAITIDGSQAAQERWQNIVVSEF
jgi:hypothetical protein